MRGLPRAPVALAIVLASALGISIAASGLPDTANGPVYTPARFAALGVRSQLKFGQVIRIRGIMQPLWPHMGPADGVIFERQRGGSDGVFVLFGPGSPVVSRLRGLPLVGPLVPPTADEPLTGKIATFRVQAVACTAAYFVCAFRSPDLQLQDGGTP